MKKDLWSDLARRVRESAPAQSMPFGFDDEVLRRLRAEARRPADPWEGWGPLLRPALGLAFATALICIGFHYQMNRVQPDLTDNLLSQTEELIQLAASR